MLQKYTTDHLWVSNCISQVKSFNHLDSISHGWEWEKPKLVNVQLQNGDDENSIGKHKVNSSYIYYSTNVPCNDICHTPIFDLRHHLHVSLDPTFIRNLTWSIYDVSVKISTEKYFKIPHFLVPSQALFSLYFLFHF